MYKPTFFSPAVSGRRECASCVVTVNRVERDTVMGLRHFALPPPRSFDVNIGFRIHEVSDEAQHAGAEQEPVLPAESDR